MTVLNPAAFYLLFAALGILLLHLLRARERRREVSALFLWEGLPGDPQSRAARLRQQIDPLLLLQLAVLLALTTAFAQPAWTTRTTSLSGLAIVLDASASMRTVTEDGVTRYRKAVDEASALLDRYPAAATAIIQLSSRPAILARPGLPSPDLRDALLRSEPTWYADGTAAELRSLLAGIGGISQFERVVWLSDRSLVDGLDGFETILVEGGENLALTAFSVRGNPEGGGVTAWVTATNDTDAYRDVLIRIEDRKNQTTLSLLMPPRTTESYVIPFPTSSGTLFTASLVADDGFDGDNLRYFSLNRPIDVRVHWLGSESRYLMAAIQSVAPVTHVDASEDADLTVVHGTRAPASPGGTVLLVHAGIEGLLTQGETVATERITVLRPDHPILEDVDPTGFRVREAPTASVPPSTDVVLAADGVPLLAVYEDETQTVLYLAPDLLETNLPITVDFPLLVRNIVAALVRVPPPLSYRSAEAGEPVSLSGLGAIDRLYDANGMPVVLPDGISTFRPEVPGFHTLITDRGAFAVAVNVSAAESGVRTSEAPIATFDPAGQTTIHRLPLWQVAAVLAILLLLAEASLHASRRAVTGRTR